MHYLKIVSRGWHGYTGQLNIISFKNGVSTEPVPPRIADRIAASVQVVQCDAEGREGTDAINVGPQHRLLTEGTVRAEIAGPLAVQSEADKVMEAKLDAARSLTAPIESLYTRDDLERVADESGIKGLRDIADKWTVKGRGIPEIIEKILTAQAAFLQLRNQKIENAGGSVLKATTLATEADLEATAAAVVEEELVALGYEGLVPEYAIDGVIVPCTSLVEQALKNSGKSLTGWNALNDPERKRAIDAEVEALEKHYGAKLEPVLAEEAPASEEQEAPVDPVEDTPEYEKWFAAKVMEAIEEFDGVLPHEDAVALIRAQLAAAKEA
ncbi:MULTISPECIES: hypothetical protein [unclassified Ensifer]|uniref:hypothetical protein n=1 Tax=unclassified Ensifer TaxID=2633371 RepID=UPI000812F110|nr:MULTISPECIES: hypothetical protein [unclassified Ensifer]OCP21904.1 hypothetical protein BC361_25380 [Ensifer sp. LC54]OCP23316.1 hypothetical protein BC363_25385 [Ensifer sp. LC384]